jgi:hypothetical protein
MFERLKRTLDEVLNAPDVRAALAPEKLFQCRR